MLNYFNFKYMTNMALAAVCAVSMLIVPNDVSAQDGCGSRSNGCCVPEEDCCASGGWGSSFLVLGGAAAAGAIAGYFAGQSNGHRGKKGRNGNGTPGPAGPAGPAGGDFITDGYQLTFMFHFVLGLSPGLAGTIQATPFVSLPDGQIIEGTQQTLPASPPGPPDYDFSVTVPSMTGTYTAGVQIRAVGIGSSLIADAVLNAVVVPTRPNALTTTIMNIILPYVVVLPLSGDQEIQPSFDFTYNIVDIP